MKLSVLMPVFNEEQWLARTVEKVLYQEVPGVDSMEIILVDDASTDKTQEVIDDLVRRHAEQIVSIRHEKNAGKGAALRTAIARMTGDICIIQDADWEYNPKEYPLILEPIISGYADCVYGSRFIGSQAKRVLFFWHYVGNSFLTLLSNMFTNLNLTDMETCYKAFRCDLLKAIPLQCNGFGFEPEITAKISGKKCRIYEVGISYQGRTYQDGKKISWVDGVKAIYYIIRFGLFKN